MGKRRKARESALQILYELEFDRSDADQTIDRFWREKKAPPEIREYSRWLVRGIQAHLEEIDEAIQSISTHWRVSRMAVVDRNILRLAAFELLKADSLAPAIVINEAIEIAKKYSSPEAATFVNGILDALSKKIQAAKSPPDEVKHVAKRRKKD